MPLARLLALIVALLAPHALAKGGPAPAFDVEDLQGNRYTLAGLAGKVVVLRFWFTACGACRLERPEINRVVDRYQGNKDVVFLALALDKKSTLRTALLKRPLRYAVVADSDELAEAYGVSAYPTHVIIDQQGNIARRWVGAVDSFYRLTETIDALTQAPGAPDPGPPVSALPLGSNPAWEPVLLVRPERPTRGSTVKLYYAPSSVQPPTEAQLAWDVHGDGSFTQGRAPLRAQGVLLSYELKIPWDATLVHLRVHSRGDRRVVEHTLPISSLDGQPVRNAFINLGACDTPLPAEREFERYPDTPFALLARLEALRGDTRSAAESARGQLLGQLKTVGGKELERLAATVDALLLTGNLEAVPPVLYKMMALDRGAFLTRRALSRLLTQPYGDVWRQWPPGLLPWAWGVLAEHDDVWSRQAAARGPAEAIDTRAAEKICGSWRAAEPGNPFAHDCLARLFASQDRLQEALGASRAAIEAASEGRLLLYQTGGWNRVLRDEERLWAHHAELSLAARDAPELAEAPEP
jgi:peroxiredoxin